MFGAISVKMRVFGAGRRYGDGCRAAAAHAASASSRGLRYAIFSGRSLAASKHRLLQRCRHMASKVRAGGHAHANVQSS